MNNKKLKRIRNIVYDEIYRKLFKKKINKKIDEKMEKLKSHLVVITGYFNEIILETTVEEYLIVLKIFRLKMPIYDGRVLAFYDSSQRRLFTNIIQPNAGNVGINDDSSIFNYNIILDIPEDEWRRYHYKKHLSRLDFLDFEMRIFIKLLNEASRKLSVYELLKTMHTCKDDLDKCMALNSLTLNPEEKRIVKKMFCEAFR